uniref:Uncharacterized protein n=1 Tax=Micrurus surinamensis TaxID=129470 RepID=A0A2D4PJN2_MICSU
MDNGGDIRNNPLAQHSETWHDKIADCDFFFFCNLQIALKKMYLIHNMKLCSLISEGCRLCCRLVIEESGPQKSVLISFKIFRLFGSCARLLLTQVTRALQVGHKHPATLSFTRLRHSNICKDFPLIITYSASSIFINIIFKKSLILLERSLIFSIMKNVN